MSFTNYLKKKEYSKRSIKNYEEQLSQFKQWLKAEELDPNKIHYTDLLDFIKYKKAIGASKNAQSRLIGSIRHYYNYLKEEKKVMTNPAAGIYLKGIPRRLPHDLLKEEQLQKIYEEYQSEIAVKKRNKVILGLVIYQGLTTKEISFLSPKALELRVGKLKIPGTKRSNRRSLELASHQILDLQEYIEKIRPEILAITQKQSDALFISKGSSLNLKNSLSKLNQHLKKHYDYYLNLEQLRQSRIAIWVKQEGLRKSQYLSGHKYVSSTERYQQIDLEELQKEITKHHPLVE